jgi:hypothetical protein
MPPAESLWKCSDSFRKRADVGALIARVNLLPRHRRGEMEFAQRAANVLTTGPGYFKKTHDGKPSRCGGK